ncbi:MAG: 8-amino-7-oxononanoate synthase, partial [Planctomycetia bacterium]|nr:8-amino-7-oxononanoate synthase [Planctomycetia bacterium]
PALEHLEAEGLRRLPRVRRGRQGREVELNGQQLLNFGSNDYLGYSGDVRLTRACSKGSCAEGFGGGASPLVSGQSVAHQTLERAIASLLSVDAALAFPSGYAANAATIPALVGEGDLIASDARNHASIIDGCRLSAARVAIYPHRDVAAAAALLAAPARRRLLVTDSLFSMDGTLAPLAELAHLASETGSMLLVDEAHATGVFGSRGSGLVEAQGCDLAVPIRIGTLSKALGSAGGFVAGHRSLIEFLRHQARSWMFSTAHPPAAAAAARRAIGLLAAEPDRRELLLTRATAFRQRLSKAGLNLGAAEAQIVPIIIGDPAHTVAAAARLAEAGFFVPAIRPPSVPVGQSLLRVSLSYLHDDAALDHLATALIAHAR